MTSQLSYQDKKGYYGLTVEPTYEEMLRSLKKQVRIPQPDRSAKWYATSIYRPYLEVVDLFTLQPGILTPPEENIFTLGFRFDE